MLPDGLHPQAATMVRRQRRVQRLLPDQSVRGLRWLTRLGAWLRDAPPVGTVHDRAIAGPDGEIPIRIYRPEGETPFPTIVYFHGGGFVSGDLESHDAVCRYLTRESECVVVAVD